MDKHPMDEDFGWNIPRGGSWIDIMAFVPDLPEAI